MTPGRIAPIAAVLYLASLNADPANAQPAAGANPAFGQPYIRPFYAGRFGVNPLYGSSATGNYYGGGATLILLESGQATRAEGAGQSVLGGAAQEAAVGARPPGAGGGWFMNYARFFGNTSYQGSGNPPPNATATAGTGKKPQSAGKPPGAN